MPCRSDYLDPTHREQELQRAAKLLEFVYKNMGKPVSAELKAAARDIYCDADYVPELCRVLKKMPADQRDAVVYDAHNATSRNLASWWEEHRAADRDRKAAERAAKRDAQLIEQARAKLTPQELAALKKHFLG